MTDKFVFNQNGDAVFKELDKKYNKHKRICYIRSNGNRKNTLDGRSKTKKGKVDC